MIDIKKWVEEYLIKAQSLFGGRLVFVGLQGSYGRGEATENSDIDVVLILDEVTSEDLSEYSKMLDSLTHRSKVCGFVSGIEELKRWEAYDLFQFYHDTEQIFGSIEFMKELIKDEDVRRAVRIGACNIYHMCVHNMVHEKDVNILKSLYKAAVFSVQAVSYLQTGVYRKYKTELLNVLQEAESKILKTAIELKEKTEIAAKDFEVLSADLLNWTSCLIKKYSTLSVSKEKVIETERLILREMNENDYSSLCKILQDEEVMYAYEGAFSDEETRNWLNKQIANYREYGHGLWAVVLKENNCMIGQCGLTWQNFNDKKVLEIGYLFQKEYWHKGYATEASIGCKEYGFNKLKADELFSIIRDINIASQNVAKRNGMVLTEKYTKHYRGIDMPHYLFSVKREK